MSAHDRIPPFPAELVNNAPAVARMTALEFGALWALCHAFWRSGAEILPAEDAALSVLARCHTRRWYDVRDVVVPAYRALEPRLVSVYAKRCAHVAGNVLGGTKAAAIVNSRRAADSPKEPIMLTESASTLALLVPSKSATANENHSIDGTVIPARVSRKGAVLLDNSNVTR